MKNVLMVVAHPDDEILWFGGTVLLNQDFSWTIACVTQDSRTPRGKDFLKVCNELKAQGILLGLKDPDKALLDEEALENKLSQLLNQEKWSGVFTHNARGEYGHSHHRQVNRLIKKIWKNPIETGFGSQSINGIVRLPAAVMKRKKYLFDFYQSEGKTDRMKLYPPYDLDFEPMVIPNKIPFKIIERVNPPTTWSQLSGMKDLACRSSCQVHKIALLADTWGWAHHILASYLKRYLLPEFDIDIFYLFNEDYSEQFSLSFDEEDYDIIHLMSWRYWDMIKHHQFPPNKLLTTIHGHRGIEKDNQQSFLKALNHFSSVSTVSQKLFEELYSFLPEIHLTPCGVDSQMFYPDSWEKSELFTFGTVGRFYGEQEESDDIKGWNLILEPLARELSFLKAKYLYIDKASKALYEAMPDFYRECHCYVCSSSSEGNPLPLLEAASCGLPLLSTDVGIAPEIIEEGVNGMILPRSKDAFAEAIKDLSNNLNMCRDMGRQSRKIILSKRDWWSVLEKWAEFYRSVL